MNAHSQILPHLDAKRVRGALASIIEDPDCCAASKAIARDALTYHVNSASADDMSCAEAGGERTPATRALGIPYHYPLGTKVCASGEHVGYIVEISFTHGEIGYGLAHPHSWEKGQATVWLSYVPHSDVVPARWQVPA